MPARTCLFMLCVLVSSLQANANELQQLADTSRDIISEFSSHLKNALTDAIQEGGPVNAIAVCKTRAPEIAEALSREGWQIRRTSLKVRNPANTSDDFERKVLEDFERRKNEGKDISQLAYYKMKEVGEQSEFRYMKAIPTDELCLTCHGNTISEAVKTRLDQLYPGDQARGFRTGDIRGAFSLKKIFRRELQGEESIQPDNAPLPADETTGEVTNSP